MLLALNWPSLRKATTILDPFLYLIFFISTINSVAIELAFFQSQADALYFLVMGIFTNLLLYWNAEKKAVPEEPPPEEKWLALTIVLLSIRFIVFDLEAVLLLLKTGSFTTVWQQAAIERQTSVDIPKYVVYSVIGFFEVYVLSYNLIFSQSRWKKILSALLISWGILCSYLAGSRAAIFYYAIAAGQFIVHFRGAIRLRILTKWMNLAGVIAGAIFIMLMTYYSTLNETVSEESSWSEGAKAVANRVFGNADGVVYFIEFERGIETSPVNFFKYNFIVINKRLLGEEYPNLGRRLYEYVMGRSVDFGGPNFTIVLQSKIIAGWFGFFYIALLCYLWGLSRRAHAARGTLLDIYLFNLGYSAVWMFIDSEAQLVRLMVVTAILSPLLLYCSFTEGWFNKRLFFVGRDDRRLLFREK